MVKPFFKCDFLEGRLPKYFFQAMCSSGGKQTIHKVSAAFTVKSCHPRTSLTLRCLKYIKRIFNPYAILTQLFIDTSAVILGKKSEIVGEIFFSSKNAICSKYEEIDVQRQTFTDEN